METKLLIAEDEEKIRRLVAGYMVREGYRVMEAADGKDALSQFERNPDV